MVAVKGLKWLLVLALVAGLVGSAVALFLWGLDVATRQRFANPQRMGTIAWGQSRNAWGMPA